MGRRQYRSLASVLLVVLAATLLLGRYRGFRLLELRRFRALSQD